MLSQPIVRPIAAVAGAIAIVLGSVVYFASWVPGSGHYVSNMVEHVSVTKKVEMQASSANAGGASNASSLLRPEIARSGRLTILVTDVDKAANLVSLLARREGGDVLSMNVENTGDTTSRASADVDVRVPSSRFDETLSALARLGQIREHSTSAEDVTADLTDSNARLRNLRRTESDILRIMDRSGTVGQVLEAENQLSQVRENIETLESELKALRTRIVYATISVALVAEAASAAVEPTPSAQIASAWTTAVHCLAQISVGLLAAVVWFVVFLPYLLIVMGIAAVIYVRTRGRVAT